MCFILKAALYCKFNSHRLNKHSTQYSAIIHHCTQSDTFNAYEINNAMRILEGNENCCELAKSQRIDTFPDNFLLFSNISIITTCIYS